jgi:hypothetical protein
MQKLQTPALPVLKVEGEDPDALPQEGEEATLEGRPAAGREDTGGLQGDMNGGGATSGKAGPRHGGHKDDDGMPGGGGGGGNLSMAELLAEGARLRADKAAATVAAASKASEAAGTVRTSVLPALQQSGLPCAQGMPECF